jgi:hypothetical protein
MPTTAETLNPFSSLAPVTPGYLNDRRAAETEDASKGTDYWTQDAARKGLQLRIAMNEHGKWMSTEDKRALQTQNILQDSQKSLAQAVKDGMDPLDAQEMAYTSAMQQFMSVGDYEAARSVIPQLNQIRTYKAEAAKINSETRENEGDLKKAESGVRRDDAATGLDVAKTGVVGAESQAQIGLRGSQAEQAAAAADQSHANAELARAKIPFLGMEKSGKGGMSQNIFGMKEDAAIRAKQSATMDLFDSLDTLSTITERSPRAASASSGAINYAGQYLSGLKSSIENKGGTMGGYEGLSDDPAMSYVEGGAAGATSPKQIGEKYEDAIEGNFKKMGGKSTLGMDIVQYKSLVVDTAYMLARTNDNGGRLSDNDFKMAVDMLGAVQDPESAKAGFYALAKRKYGQYKNFRTPFQPERYQYGFGGGDKILEEKWAKFERVWGPPPAGRPGPRSKPAPAGPPTGVNEPADITVMRRQLLGGP